MAGPFELYEVLEGESVELSGPLPANYPEATLPPDYPPPRDNGDARLTAICDLIHKRARDGHKRTALCFSGGGIRSATFGLGVLQGLARRGLLKEFDYLSTVSGGGYLGGWFSAWLKRERDTEGSAQAALQKIEAELNTPPAPKLQPEPEPVRHLRSYSNYMSPRLGLLSADTWTLVAIYFRNLFLNQLVLVPLILGVLAVPRLSLAVARWQSNERGGGDWVSAAYWLAVVSGILALSYIISNRPSLADLPPSGMNVSRLPKKFRVEWWFLILSLLPLLLLASMITTYWAWLRLPSDQLKLAPLGLDIHNAAAFALFGVLLYGGAYLLAQFFFVRRVLRPEPFVAAATGAIGGLLTYLVATNVPFFDNPVARQTATDSVLSTSLYICLAAPAFLLLFLAASTIFVGLASFYTTDADREWLARAGAWGLIAPVGWVAVSLIRI